MNQTVVSGRMKFIPWVAGILFKVGLQGLSWQLADWYTDRYLPWAKSTLKPVSPVIPNRWSARNVPSRYPEVIYAKDQPEYNPLPSIKQSDGCVTTRWQMTWRERFIALFHGSVYLQVLTFNEPLQPLKMSVTPPELQPVNQFEPADIYQKAEAFR